jgi:AraC-like DNA-binding protein
MARAPAVEYVEGAVFRGYRPSPRLADAVALIWTVDGLPTVLSDRVLPNGVVELIFNLGDPQRVLHGAGRFTRFQRAWIAGLQRGPLDIATERDSRLVGIRFRPGGAAPLLGLPLAELTDQVVELEGGLARGFGELRDRLGQASDDGERLALVEAVLTDRLARGPGVDPRVALATRRLSRGNPSVGELARGLGVSHKHLIDLFHREVGVGPKMLGRILRLQRVLAELERPGSGRLLPGGQGHRGLRHLRRLRGRARMGGDRPDHHLSVRAAAGPAHLHRRRLPRRQPHHHGRDPGRLAVNPAAALRREPTVSRA